MGIVNFHSSTLMNEQTNKIQSIFISFSPPVFATHTQKNTQTRSFKNSVLSAVMLGLRLDTTTVPRLPRKTPSNVLPTHSGTVVKMGRALAASICLSRISSGTNSNRPCCRGEFPFDLEMMVDVAAMGIGAARPNGDLLAPTTRYKSFDVITGWKGCI